MISGASARRFPFGRLQSDALLRHALRPDRQAGRPVRVQSLGGGERVEARRPRDVRRRLFARDPLCCWCRERMILIERGPDNLVDGRRVPPHPEEATIEHLISRNDPRRGFVPGRLALSHHRCNNRRGQEEQTALPIQTRWEQSRAIYYIAKRDGALNEVDGWTSDDRSR